MAIIVNTKSYTEDAQLNQNAIRYAGPNNGFTSADRIDVKRSYPKPTSQSAGVAKSSMKTTRGFLVGDVVKTVIMETTTSVPVGVTEVQAQAVLDDHEALIGGTVGTGVALKLNLKY